MILLPYNLSDQLLRYLKQIDELKIKYLLLEISPIEVRKIRFETEVFRLHGLLSAMGEKIPKSQLIETLTATRKRDLTQKNVRLRTLKYFISSKMSEWTLNPRKVSPAAIFDIAHHLDHHLKTHIKPSALRSVFQYIENGRDPSFVGAFLVFHSLMPDPKFRGSLFAASSLVASFMLAQAGYDFRRFMVFEEVFFHSQEELEGVYLESVAHGNLTIILEATAHEMVRQLERDLERVKNRTRLSGVPASFFQLTERQKEIVAMIDKPQMVVTNRLVQKEFSISQVTASRDLARLLDMGLLYPHGKGRSLYYTRI